MNSVLATEHRVEPYVPTAADEEECHAMTVDCARCHGGGVVPPADACPVCGGSGNLATAAAPCHRTELESIARQIRGGELYHRAQVTAEEHRANLRATCSADVTPDERIADAYAACAEIVEACLAARCPAAGDDELVDLGDVAYEPAKGDAA